MKTAFAPQNLIKEVYRNDFLLILLEEEKSLDKITEMTKSLKSAERICYVCLSKPYADIYENLKAKGVNVKKIYFIDTLSAHYEKKKSSENCVFLDSPTDFANIRAAISKAIKEKKCSVVIFDTISAMLIYQETSNIVRFTHDFLSEERENSKIIYLIIKHDSMPPEENEKLANDLSMFADKTINVK